MLGTLRTSIRLGALPFPAWIRAFSFLDVPSSELVAGGMKHLSCREIERQETEPLIGVEAEGAGHRGTGRRAVAGMQSIAEGPVRKSGSLKPAWRNMHGDPPAR